MANTIGTVMGSVLLVLLAGCGAASVSEPDSTNPAHCVAAFHYGRTIALRGKASEKYLAIQATGRALYEAKKLKTVGRFDDIVDEGQPLVDTYAGDDEAMMGLLRDCAMRQDADPDFRALDESGALMAAARKVDPICQRDVACRNYNQ